jgi:hypothetical protein
VTVVHRVSAAGMYVLALIALGPLAFIAARALVTGYVPPRETDEGTAAHVFQLAVLLLVLAGATYLVTADWTRPGRVVLRLVPPVLFLCAAFAILFAYEHS